VRRHSCNRFLQFFQVCVVDLDFAGASEHA
jgi:hypothetical protein